MLGLKKRIIECWIKIKYLVKDGFFHIILGNTLNKMIAFVSSIVIVRLVTKPEYACLSYADNLYSYINLFAGLGVSTAILKFCAPDKEVGINKFYFNLSMKVGILFQFSLSLLLVIYIYRTNIAFEEAKPLIYIMVLYPAFVQVETTVQSYVRAMLHNKLFAKMGVVQTGIAFISSLLLVLIIGVNGIVISRYIAITIAILCAYKFMRNNLPKKESIIHPARREIKRYWNISISLMLANLFSMIMPINEMFLINNLIRDKVITANYKVAILIPSQIVFIASSIIVYVFPKIAQMDNKKEKVFRYISKVGLALFGIIIGICVIGSLLTPFVIRVVYGAKYEDAITLSKIYWIVYGLNAGIRMLPMNMLPAMGIALFNSVLSIITCVIHAVLLYGFIGKYGIYGAAYALILVYLISGVLYWVYLFKVCKKKEGV